MVCLFQNSFCFGCTFKTEFGQHFWKCYLMCCMSYLPFYFKHSFLLLFLHNSHGTQEIPDCGNLVRPDWVGNLRWDNTEPYEPFRWVNTEPSVRFRKANTDPSVQFRKANTDPSMQFRWDHTEFLSCKMLGKNLHESVRPLSHLQTSPGKSSCQDAFGKSLCNALPYCHPSELPSQNLAILYK